MVPVAIEPTREVKTMKIEYIKPVLSELGSVADLTEGTLGGHASDEVPYAPVPGTFYGESGA